MKTKIPLLTLLIAAIMLPCPMKAQDTDELIKAAKSVVEALNHKDVETYNMHLHSDFTRFLAQSPVLLTNNDIGGMKEAFENGMNFDMQLSDLKAAFYGNTAVLTGFETGPANLPDGRVIDGKRKYTSVWVKENGKWKEVHLHISRVEE